jgi:hypothetical protein
MSDLTNQKLYYLIRLHPDGRGYAAVLGFTDEWERPEATVMHLSFPSIMRAMRYALAVKPPQGVLVHEECDGYRTVPS